MHTWQMWGHSKSYVQHLQGLGSFSTATFPSLIVCLYLAYCRLLQELSYRKQIAHQLRRQYVEDTHRPKYYTVTLKSYNMSKTLQGHWKRNHWTDHTRLTISGVFDVKYYRDFEMWIRRHSRSLKVVPFESLGTVFWHWIISWFWYLA